MVEKIRGDVRGDVIQWSRCAGGFPGRNGITSADRKKFGWRSSTSNSNIAMEGRPDTARCRITLIKTC